MEYLEPALHDTVQSLRQEFMNGLLEGSKILDRSALQRCACGVRHMFRGGGEEGVGGRGECSQRPFLLPWDPWGSSKSPQDWREPLSAPVRSSISQHSSLQQTGQTWPLYQGQFRFWNSAASNGTRDLHHFKGYPGVCKALRCSPSTLKVWFNI